MASFPIIIRKRIKRRAAESTSACLRSERTPPLESTKHTAHDQTPPLDGTLEPAHETVAESPIGISPRPQSVPPPPRPQFHSTPMRCSGGASRKKRRTEKEPSADCGGTSDSSTPPLMSPTLRPLTRPPHEPQLEAVTTPQAMAPTKNSGNNNPAAVGKLSNSSTDIDEVLFSPSLMAEFVSEPNSQERNGKGNGLADLGLGGKGLEPGAHFGQEELGEGFVDDEGLLESFPVMEGARPEDMEQELGLYPEHFSCLFNSSAFLPQEEYGADATVGSDPMEGGHVEGPAASEMHATGKSFISSQAQYPPTSPQMQSSFTKNEIT